MALRLDQSLPALEDRALVRVRRRAPGLTFDATLAPWWVVGEAAAMERALTTRSTTPRSGARPRAG